MALDKQITILSVDTGDFYSNHEARLHWLNHKLRSERNKVKANAEYIKRMMIETLGVTKEQFADMEDGIFPDDCEDGIVCGMKRYIQLKDIISMKNEKIKKSKEALLTLLENKVNANIASDGKDHIRCIREDAITEGNNINVFDSSLIRTIGVNHDEFTDDFLVVQIYYFDVFKDIEHYGFMYKGEKYIYYTSSAGQIRTKKAVFIKESVWNKYEKTIMCGLTMKIINSKGGNNPNKHLAYTALSNSATDLWEDFDIDKCIVIDDFETNVFGTYDLINDEDYSIKRVTDYVPIPHTDGAGMMLPCMGKNRMVRLPWIKGLLGVFDFVRFIEKHNCSPVIKDIYGVEHNVMKEQIQVIFTKSQFKMYKYYDSWEQYKQAYKEYGCTAGYTNLEEDRIRKATINYQMLQTLTDFTEDEVRAIAQKSVDKLTNIGSSVENMKEIFGVVKENKSQTYLQKSIDLYPNIMNDEFLKIKLRDIKDSLLKKYRAGKLVVDGKYTFLLPDFYAACEYWFMGIENPKGLLGDGEVFCWLFKRDEKLDCLRSPHLYKEHAVRYNMACNKFPEKRDKIREWFTTDAVYTSCHDLISKILQFDVDGDKSLVVADKTLIEVAERNVKNIVPLYYNMRKAENVILTNETIYEGLVAAFTGGNIGIYSNDISKIWNSEVFISGTEEEKQQAINAVKWLCMENNFCIDMAKTLYMPTRPKWANEIIRNFTKAKVPHFFTYAKDKESSQVEAVNGSFVNRLNDIIPKTRLNCRGAGLEAINYKVLMSNPDIEVKIAYNEDGKMVEAGTNPLIFSYQNIIRKHYVNTDFLTKKKRELDSLGGEVLSNSALRTEIMYGKIRDDIKKEISEFGYSESEVADILVKYLYHIKDSDNKNVLWLCYGDTIYNNIKHNLENMTEEEIKAKKVIKTKVVICSDCGCEVELPSTSRTKRCPSCAAEYKKMKSRETSKRNRMKSKC